MFDLYIFAFFFAVMENLGWDCFVARPSTVGCVAGFIFHSWMQFTGTKATRATHPETYETMDVCFEQLAKNLTVQNLSNTLYTMEFLTWENTRPTLEFG
jgi:hypothetical protein